jgi:hypothetical protein
VHESETDIPFLRPNHLHIFSFAPCLASRGSNGTGPGPHAVYQSWDTGSDRSKIMYSILKLLRLRGEFRKNDSP